MSSQAPTAESIERRPGGLEVMVLLCAIVAAMVLSVVLRVQAEEAAQEKGLRSDGVDYFDEGTEQRETMLKRLGRSQDVVLIGNSMLGSRIDRHLLRQEAAPLRADLLKEGNTFSLVWYLTLREVCATSEAKRPKVAVIFFRDRFLTWPGFRSNDNGIAFAEGLAGGGPLSEEVMRRVDGTLGDANALESSLAYLKSPSDAAVTRVSDWALDATRLAHGKEERREYMNERFSLGNLRHDLPADVGSELLTDGEVMMNGYTTPEKFADALEGSFLPAMVEMAREANVQLVFFRVMRRPEKNGMPEQSESLDQYLSDLRAYAGQQGVLLIDENDTMPFSVSDYADGDHVSDESRPAYTRWFWQTLESVPGVL
ncbi:hypothetical protein [Sulfuriroseicoccus oceanibius]|uniref:DUF1574 domain-containing protein n=1 Tax=Sulfuriroseicoccus oceanibius TaxID=2707525 RepID=A0A6B3LE58_9BACT|nr:hypothetical protein [Sulfuriroseicoccus oceanibius]QQL46008.1 hypothetical protein G3M56_005360 [Sulfuriroseicoccus oceanibius]